MNSEELKNEVRSLEIFNCTNASEETFSELLNMIDLIDEIRSIINQRKYGKFNIEEDAKAFGKIIDLFEK